MLLHSLEEKVDPHTSALLVIDMQNDYCSRKGAFASLGFDPMMITEMTPRLTKLIDKARQVDVPVIWTRTLQNEWFLSDVWSEHKTRRQRGLHVSTPALQSGSWGAEFIDEVKPHEDELVVTKHRYNAFYGTDLEVALKAKGIRSLIFSGVSTNVCVESTARDAFFHDYYVVFTSDCTATNNGGKQAHLATLDNIDRCFGIVVNSEEIIQCWDKLYWAEKNASERRNMPQAIEG